MKVLRWGINKKELTENLRILDRPTNQ